MQTAQQMQTVPAHLPTPRAAHGRRCRHLPPVQPGESERLVAEFLSRHPVTVCPTRYAVAIEQRPLLTRGGY